MVQDIISTIDPDRLRADPGEQVRLTLAHVNEKICADVELYAYMANNLSMDFVLGHIEKALVHYAKTYGVESLPRELLADGDPGYYRPRFYLAGAVSVYSEWLCSDRTRPIEDVAEVVADALGHARWSAVQGGEQAKAAAAGIKKTELFPQNGGSPAAFHCDSLA